MRVTVHFLGILSDYFQTARAELELVSPATRQDLLVELGRLFGPQLPPRLWDHQGNRFIPGVHIIGKDGDLDDPEGPLSEDDEVNVLMPLAGG